MADQLWFYSVPLPTHANQRSYGKLHHVIKDCLIIEMHKSAEVKFIVLHSFCHFLTWDLAVLIAHFHLCFVLVLFTSHSRPSQCFTRRCAWPKVLVFSLSQKVMQGNSSILGSYRGILGEEISSLIISLPSPLSFATCLYNGALIPD